MYSTMYFPPNLTCELNLDLDLDSVPLLLISCNLILFYILRGSCQCNGHDGWFVGLALGGYFHLSRLVCQFHSPFMFDAADFLAFCVCCPSEMRNSPPTPFCSICDRLKRIFQIFFIAKEFGELNNVYQKISFIMYMNWGKLLFCFIIFFFVFLPSILCIFFLFNQFQIFCREPAVPEKLKIHR